jgi:Skp family chaperone for outer membrane proteins
MKTLRLFIVSAIFTIIISLSAFAQPAAGGKVGVIYSEAFFDEKLGITRVVSVNKILQTEFAPRVRELETLGTRLDTLQKEIKALQDKAATVPIDQSALQGKAEEFERLQREGKFKQEELNKAIDARRGSLLGPVFQEIGKSLGDFSKTKGLSFIFDGSKDQAGMLIYVAEGNDLTEEFVKLFNAKPATTAATKPPVTPK